MWKKYYIRHNLLVKAVVINLISFIVVVAGIYPLFNKVQATFTKIEVRAKEQKILSEKIVLLSGLDKSVLKERAKIIKSALPEKKDVISYLSAIDGLSNDLGLSFGGIVLNPGDVSEKGLGDAKSKKKQKQVANLQILDTEVKISGSKDGLYTFLKMVEQTLPLMQVANVKISATGQDNFTLSLSLGMLWAPYLANDVKGAVSMFTDKEEKHFLTLSEYKIYENSSGSEDFLFNALGKTDLFAN